MIGKQHLSPCDGWQTEPRRDDGYRVFQWAHGPNYRALENDYHAWLRKTQPDVYAEIFPEKGANESTAYSNKASTGTPIDHVEKEAHYSHWVASCTLDFIHHSRDQTEPFCLVANFFDPHHAFGAPQEFRDLIDSDTISVPNTRDDELSNKPPEQLFYSKKSYAGVAPGFQDYTAEHIREIRAQYNISATTRQIFEVSKNRPEAEYREALQVRKAAISWFSKLFEQYDAMLTPSALAEAPLMGSTGDPICCTLFSLAGVPSVNLPILKGKSGLPIGVQLVSAYKNDHLLMSYARQLLANRGLSI